MQSFFILFNRYLSERAKGQKMCVVVKVGRSDAQVLTLF